MTDRIIVLGFYKYVEIKNSEVLAENLRQISSELKLKGNILLAEEGINASISGTPESIEKVKSELKEINEFKDLFFKEEETFEHPFKKMKVKLKKEIVAFKHPVDLKNTGKHISPDELSQLYEDGKLKPDVVILDARNNYEYQIGKFKDAIHLDIKVFRDFQNKLNELEKFRDKKVVMYCTGGVRCEKASAFLKENGFKSVFQLNQGIIQFGKELPENIWEGKCFVFDKRMVSPINKDGIPISQCLHCGTNCDFQRNCRNPECNLFHISCLNCEDKLQGCCSEECRLIYQRENAKRQQVLFSGK